MAASAAAQGTTTSQQRLPTTKDAPGEVVPTKVDTVTNTVYRTDTTRIYQTDTVRMTVNVPGPVTTITRVDTVTIQPMAAAPHRQVGGLYFGVGAGGTLPYGSIQTVDNPAFGMQMQLGYQGLGNVFGIRADENYAQFSDNAAYANLGPHPDVYNTSVDLTAQVPYLDHLFGYAPRFSVYVLGGGTLTEYRNLRISENSGQVGVGVNNVTPADGGVWHNGFGWNGGVGVAFHWRATAIFAESRLIAFNPANSSSARQIPLTLGLNFY
jgi:hypothetical protein